MKKVLLFTAFLATCLLASCAHNASMLGAGTAFRIGSGEVSLHYADGLFLTNVSRENVRFTAELDSTMGFTYDPTTDTYKGIKGITYEIGPQLGGYSQELGEKNPEALKSYFDALAAYYEYRSKQSDELKVSDDKSKSAMQAVVDAVKAAVEKHGKDADTGEDANGGDSGEEAGGSEEECESCAIEEDGAVEAK